MQLTSNTRAFIEAEQYSDFILRNLEDGLLPEAWYRNVTDLGSGETLHIKTVGAVTLQDAAEDVALNYNPIESGEITFQITEYVGDAWYVTEDLRVDGAQIEQLMVARAQESTRAQQEAFETKYLATAAKAYPLSDPYQVNGFAHKVVSAATNNTMTLDHFIEMRLAFDKADVPSEARVAIVDPIVEATFNKLVTITSEVTPYGQRIIEQGMASGQRFVGNLMGWDIVLCNRLHKGDANDGTTSITNGVWNLFMCVRDDQCKPMIAAWRRKPQVRGEFNKDLDRDEYVTRSRYGFGVQRMDTLAVVVTSQTATE